VASGAAAAVERASGLQGLIYAGLVLSAASIVLVVHAAGEEPYFFFHVSDFVENVVGGVLLCALFAAWAIACIRYARRAPRALRTLFATACVLWAVINLFYLVTMIHGYHQDLKRFGAWLAVPSSQTR
jgi:glucose-6-phosphate isomerase